MILFCVDTAFGSSLTIIQTLEHAIWTILMVSHVGSVVGMYSGTQTQGHAQDMGRKHSRMVVSCLKWGHPGTCRTSQGSNQGGCKTSCSGNLLGWWVDGASGLNYWVGCWAAVAGSVDGGNSCQRTWTWRGRQAGRFGYWAKSAS